METVEKTVQHQWESMKEYELDEKDIGILCDIEEGNSIDIIKKIPVNHYFDLRENGSVEQYNSIINYLKKEGLDIGKGDCEYGWKMPLIEKRRKLRIFKRH